MAIDSSEPDGLVTEHEDGLIRSYWSVPVMGYVLCIYAHDETEARERAEHACEIAGETPDWVPLNLRVAAGRPLPVTELLPSAQEPIPAPPGCQVELDDDGELRILGHAKVVAYSDLSRDELVYLQGRIEHVLSHGSLGTR